MHDIILRSLRVSAAVAALGALIIPAAASAQDVPSYAQPTVVSTDETIHGRIASVDGAFTISVNDDRGFVDNISLHQGTIINPTGLSLAPGMVVTIAGYNAGSELEANEIDTPYAYSGPLPTPVYLGPGYWCPGFAYGYGPSFSLAIVFGGGYHFENHPFFGRPWNGHAYFGSYVGRASGPAGRSVGYTGGGATDRRYPTDDHRAVETHAPAAFAGRSFAGQPYTGERHANPDVVRGSAESRGYAQSYARPATVSRQGGAAGQSFHGSPSRGGESRGGGHAESRGGANHH